MKSTKLTCATQQSLFDQEATNVKSTVNGNQQIASLSTYLKTRGGLFRLLALFPGNMPVTEALQAAPFILTKTRKEVAL